MARRFSSALVLATVCLSLAVITVNITFLNIGLPSLARELNASNTALEWIVDSYALVFAGLLLAAGSLGDRFGRKFTLFVGLGIFGISSALAALAHSTGELIVARCIMGAGAAFVMPMTLSILTNIYLTEDGLRRAIGVWAAVASAAAVIAPLTAGILLAHFWWGSLFVANIPLCAGTMLAVAIVVPDSVVRDRVPIDWGGVVLSVLFAAGLVASLIEGPDRGWQDPLVLIGLFTSLGLMVVFCWWELRVAQPLIDVRFFRLPQFSAGCFIVALQYFFSFGVGFAVTQYLQLVLGYSPLRAGIVLMPSAVVVMIVAPLGARAFGRWGGRTVAPIALVVMAASGFGLVAVGVDSTFWPILASLMLSSGAVGLMAAGTTSMVMSALPPEKSGMASGTQSATRQLGGALGIAVIGSLLAARYAATLAHSLAGTPGAPFTATAQRSLASALSLPHAAASVQELVGSLARAAFVDAIHSVGVAVGALALVSAGAVYAILPRRSPASTASLEIAEEAPGTVDRPITAPPPVPPGALVTEEPT